MSIEKIISPTLSNLIAEINFTLEEQESTLKDKVRALCDQAESEGYTKEEIRQLIKEKIPRVSQSTIQRSIPEHLKFNEKRNKPQLEDKTSDAVIDRIPDDKITDIPERDPVIPTAYDIREAELAGEQEQPNEGKEIDEMELPPKQEIPPHIILQLQQLETVQQRVKELLVRNEELETKLQDKAFDEIKNTSKDSIKTGTYDLEIKDKIIPLKWNYAPTINRMVIELDVNRARRMGI